MNSLSALNLHIKTLQETENLANAHSFNLLATCNYLTEFQESPEVVANAAERIDALRNRMTTSILGSDANNQSDRRIVIEALDQATLIVQLFSQNRGPMTEDTADAIESLVRATFVELENLTHISEVLNGVFNDWEQRVHLYQWNPEIDA